MFRGSAGSTELTSRDEEHPTRGEDEARSMDLQIYCTLDKVKYLEKISEHEGQKEIGSYISVILCSFVWFLSSNWDYQLTSSDEFTVPKDLLE